jgi:hypothetical protein
MVMLLKKLQQRLPIKAHPLSLTVLVNNFPKNYSGIVGKEMTEEQPVRLVYGATRKADRQGEITHSWRKFSHETPYS